jgi:hypothetical protein
MEDMGDRFGELCRIFRVLTWRKLGLVERVAWMGMFGWGNISNMATCKSEGNGDKGLLKWMVGKGISECQPGRGVRIVNRTHFSYAWC